MFCQGGVLVDSSAGKLESPSRSSACIFVRVEWAVITRVRQTSTNDAEIMTRMTRSLEMQRLCKGEPSGVPAGRTENTHCKHIRSRQSMDSLATEQRNRQWDDEKRSWHEPIEGELRVADSLARGPMWETVFFHAYSLKHF